MGKKLMDLHEARPLALYIPGIFIAMVVAMIATYYICRYYEQGLLPPGIFMLLELTFAVQATVGVVNNHKSGSP